MAQWHPILELDKLSSNKDKFKKAVLEFQEKIKRSEEFKYILLVLKINEEELEQIINLKTIENIEI